MSVGLASDLTHLHAHLVQSQGAKQRSRAELAELEGQITEAEAQQEAGVQTKNQLLSRRLSQLAQLDDCNKLYTNLTLQTGVISRGCDENETQVETVAGLQDRRQQFLSNLQLNRERIQARVGIAAALQEKRMGLQRQLEQRRSVLETELEKKDRLEGQAAELEKQKADLRLAIQQRRASFNELQKETERKVSDNDKCREKLKALTSANDSHAERITEQGSAYSAENARKRADLTTLKTTTEDLVKGIKDVLATTKEISRCKDKLTEDVEKLKVNVDEKRAEKNDRDKDKTTQEGRLELARHTMKDAQRNLQDAQNKQVVAEKKLESQEVSFKKMSLETRAANEAEVHSSLLHMEKDLASKLALLSENPEACEEEKERVLVLHTVKQRGLELNSEMTARRRALDTAGRERDEKVKSRDSVQAEETGLIKKLQELGASCKKDEEIGAEEIGGLAEQQELIGGELERVHDQTKELERKMEAMQANTTSCQQETDEARGRQEDLRVEMDKAKENKRAESVPLRLASIREQHIKSQEEKIEALKDQVAEADRKLKEESMEFETNSGDTLRKKESELQEAQAEENARLAMLSSLEQQQP